MSAQAIDFNDASGTITAGGVAQTALAANQQRRYILVQNCSDTTMWVNFGVAAVQDEPSIKLTAGSALEFSEGTGVIPRGYVSVIGATTGKSFTIKEA